MNGLSFSGWLGSGTDFSWQRGRAVLRILTAGYPVMATGDILCPPKQDAGKRRAVLKHCRAGLEVSGAPQKKNPNQGSSCPEDPTDEMQDDATGKDKCAGIFLSSRMNIWIGCCELEGRYDARPGCSGRCTGQSWKQEWQLSGTLQQSVSECSSRK